MHKWIPSERPNKPSKSVPGLILFDGPTTVNVLPAPYDD